MNKKGLIGCALFLLMQLNAFNQENLSVKRLDYFFGDYNLRGLGISNIPNENNLLITGGLMGDLLINEDTLSSLNVNSFIGIKDSLWQWNWAQIIEGNKNNQINAFTLTEENIVISGVYSDTLKIGENFLASESYQSTYICMLDKEGNHAWSISLDLMSLGGRQFLFSCNNGDIIFGTEFIGKFIYEDSIFTSNKTRNALLFRIKNDGDIIGLVKLDSDEPVFLNGLQELPSGNLLVSGLYSSNIDINSHIIEKSGRSDFFIIALDSIFIPQWTLTSRGEGVKTLNSCYVNGTEIIIAGSYRGQLELQDAILPFAGFEQNIFLTKMDQNGNVIWHETILGLSHKVVKGLSIGRNNQIYLLGAYRGNINFLEYSFQTEGLSYEYFISKFSENGDKIWFEPASNKSEINASINFDSKDGNLYLIGNNSDSIQMLYGRELDSESKGVFLINLFDCEFGDKINLPIDTIFCGHGVLNASEGFESYLWNNSHSSQTFEVFNTGLVHLEVIDRNGCVSRDSIFVEVLPKFEIAIFGNTMLCPNDDNTMLWVEVDADVYWNTGETGQAIFALNSGEYKAIAINYAGCEAESSVFVSYFDSYPPILEDYYMVSLLDTIEIYPGEYASYLWNGQLTEPILVINGSSYPEGVYEFSLEVLDNNGCYYKREFYADIMEIFANSSGVSLDGINGFQIFENHQACDFYIYPNPGVTPLSLSPKGEATMGLINEKNSLLEVLVWGSQGELVYKEELNSKQYPWTILLGNGLTPGNYIVSLVINGDVCNVKKVVIAK